MGGGEEAQGGDDGGGGQGEEGAAVQEVCPAGQGHREEGLWAHVSLLPSTMMTRLFQALTF